MQDEPPRLLHRKLEHGYTSIPALAATGEPEAVSATIQRGLTEDAHQRRSQEVHAEWRLERDRILAVLDRVQRRPWAAPLQSQIAHMRNDLKRMGQRLP